MRTIPMVLVLALAPFTNAISQEQLQPGQRVRVTVPSLDLSKHQDTFQRTVGDTLVLSSASYALSDVTRLEMYQGRQSHPWRGAGVGFVAGWAIGFAAWHIADIGCYEYTVESACAAVLGGGVGALAGALIGAMVGGSIWKTDKWEEVPLDRLRVSIVPTGNGVGIGARIAF